MTDLIKLPPPMLANFCYVKSGVVNLAAQTYNKFTKVYCMPSIYKWNTSQFQQHGQILINITWKKTETITVCLLRQVKELKIQRSNWTTATMSLPCRTYKTKNWNEPLQLCVFLLFSSSGNCNYEFTMRNKQNQSWRDWKKPFFVCRCVGKDTKQLKIYWSFLVVFDCSWLRF